MGGPEGAAFEMFFGVLGSPHRLRRPLRVTALYDRPLLVLTSTGEQGKRDKEQEACDAVVPDGLGIQIPNEVYIDRGGCRL